jgi:hypothetical protein
MIFVRGQFMPGSPKIQPKQWRDFYAAALRGHGDSLFRQLQVSVAMTLCMGRLLEIFPKRSSEREQIEIALDDLRILGGLYKKYG